MSDGEGGDQQVQDQQQQDQQQVGQGGDQQQDQQQAAAPPEWLAGLPEDLRADATLIRYGSIEDLARGHVEARKVASSRVILPAADADDAAWAKFGEALRPAEAKDYDIPLPEGMDPEGPMAKFAESFREKAHELGIPPRWAKAVAEWNNEFIAADIEARNAESQAELEAFKAETPDYAAREAKAKELVKALGWDDTLLTELNLTVGTRPMMEGLFQLADKFGEPGRIDPAKRDPSLAGGDVSDAKAQLAEFDKGNREKINAGDPETMRHRRRLLDAANLQAAGKKPA